MVSNGEKKPVVVGGGSSTFIVTRIGRIIRDRKRLKSESHPTTQDSAYGSSGQSRRTWRITNGAASLTTGTNEEEDDDEENHGDLGPFRRIRYSADGPIYQSVDEEDVLYLFEDEDFSHLTIVPPCQTNPPQNEQQPTSTVSANSSSSGAKSPSLEIHRRHETPDCCLAEDNSIPRSFSCDESSDSLVGRVTLRRRLVSAPAVMQFRRLSSSTPRTIKEDELNKLRHQLSEITRTNAVLTAERDVLIELALGAIILPEGINKDELKNHVARVILEQYHFCPKQNKFLPNVSGSANELMLIVNHRHHHQHQDSLEMQSSRIRNEGTQTLYSSCCSQAVHLSHSRELSPSNEALSTNDCCSSTTTTNRPNSRDSSTTMTYPQRQDPLNSTPPPPPPPPSSTMNNEDDDEKKSYQKPSRKIIILGRQVPEQATGEFPPNSDAHLELHQQALPRRNSCFKVSETYDRKAHSLALPMMQYRNSCCVLWNFRENQCDQHRRNHSDQPNDSNDDNDDDEDGRTSPMIHRQTNREGDKTLRQKRNRPENDEP